MAEILGTEGNDELVSAAHGDVVNGLAGNDVLETEHINVTLNGDDGDDYLTSYGNNNVLNGGPGNDSLNVGDPVQDNVLNGDAGNDELIGNFYNDELNGGPGDDLLMGGGGKDTLNGSEGDDKLVGDDLFGPAYDDVFQFSFTVAEEPGEAKNFKFTDWLSEKYGKDFGDELPDFERGHHHHGHHHHHGKHHHHNHHHGHHHHHHHKHGGCDDHQPQQWGLSQSFFSKNYSEWLREVVVPDLEAQGLAYDANGNGRIDIGLNQKDPDGTPRIEGMSDEQLSAIFGDRDEVTLRHHHHGHDRWYSNNYKSSSSETETTIVSEDGFDTIVDFDFVVGEQGDQLDFSGITEEQFLASFIVDDTQDLNNDSVLDTRIAIDGSDNWSLTLLSVSGHDLEAFAMDSMFS